MMQSMLFDYLVYDTQSIKVASHHDTKDFKSVVTVTITLALKVIVKRRKVDFPIHPYYQV